MRNERFCRSTWLVLIFPQEGQPRRLSGPFQSEPLLIQKTPLASRERLKTPVPGMQAANASAPLEAVLCWPLLRSSLAPSFASIASVTKSITDVSCVTQCNLEGAGGGSFGMRVANCVTGSSAFGIRRPSSSIPADDRDRADACDGGESSSPSARPLPSSCAPSSRQPPLADDRDHQGATSRAPCDDGADRSSPSACCLRHFPATTGSRNSLPAERGPGLRSRGSSVWACWSAFLSEVDRLSHASEAVSKEPGAVQAWSTRWLTTRRTATTRGAIPVRSGSPRCPSPRQTELQPCLPAGIAGFGTLMKDPDLVPLAAWMMWEVFFDEPEPTNAHRQDDQKRKPPEVKTPRRSQ